MRHRWIVASLFVLACNRDRTSPESAAAAPSYYSDAELRALGVRVEKLNDHQTLLCSGGMDLNCVCVEPLPCRSETTNQCRSLKETVRVTRQALRHRQARCTRGEVGRCDSFRYFDLEGNGDRDEISWFDEKGQMVAVRYETDHFAYCDGRARKRLLGRPPRCTGTERTEPICGKP